MKNFDEKNNFKNSPKGFWGAFKKAQKVVNNTQKTAEIASAAAKKIGEQTGRISRVRGDIENLVRMLQNWIKGDYKKVPIQTIVLAVSALIYFINPFDVIHDYLPAIGFMDDITLIAFIMNSIKKDIDEYLVWEKHSKR